MVDAMLRSKVAHGYPNTGDRLRPGYVIDPKVRSYKQQYANLYWLRLVVLRPKVEARAKKLWSKLEGGKTPPEQVKRVLDVENGKLCYIIGTIYMDMALKPNVLEDLAREHAIAVPPPRKKYISANDEVMLEDESGRVRLVGERIVDSSGSFVTGTIIAALGAETAEGDFEVLEFCHSGLPPQPSRSLKPRESSYVALISNLQMGSTTSASELRTEMLLEWMLGELGNNEDDRQKVRKITKIILAGNSLAQIDISLEDSKKPRRYGYDSSTYSVKPTTALDNFLAELLPSVTIDLLPGETDPTAPTMPQQPLHPAMLPQSRNFDRFVLGTNPFWTDVGGASFFGTSGQPLDDIFKYINHDDRLSMAEKTLEWAHVAPTCPDTLWCYPFADEDPFILHQSPNVYFIGNQEKFETKLVQGDEGQVVRIVLIPKFDVTGEIVLVDTESLEVHVVSFAIN